MTEPGAQVLREAGFGFHVALPLLPGRHSAGRLEASLIFTFP